MKKIIDFNTASNEEVVEYIKTIKTSKEMLMVFLQSIDSGYLGIDTYMHNRFIDAIYDQTKLILEILS